MVTLEVSRVVIVGSNLGNRGGTFSTKRLETNECRFLERPKEVKLMRILFVLVHFNEVIKERLGGVLRRCDGTGGSSLRRRRRRQN